VNYQYIRAAWRAFDQRQSRAGAPAVCAFLPQRASD
jgi:hypothetical protein